jgi:hypothetical protein
MVQREDCGFLYFADKYTVFTAAGRFLHTSWHQSIFQPFSFLMFYDYFLQYVGLLFWGIFPWIRVVIIRLKYIFFACA